MKNLFLILYLVFTSSICCAQEKPAFYASELKSKEHMVPMAKKAANYILSMPADTTDKMWTDASSYLFFFMEKTKDYTFAISHVHALIMQESHTETYVLFAAMAECMFKDKTLSAEQIDLYAFKKLISYANQPANKLTPGKELIKMMDADRKNKLEKYLKDLS